MTQAEAEQLYSTTSVKPAIVARQSKTSGTKRKTDSIVQKLAYFLSRFPSQPVSTVHDCPPADVLVFR